MEIHFPDELTKDPILKRICFPALIGNMPVECRISREALEDRFGAEWDSGAVDIFQSHRQEIENTAERLIRDGRFEEDKSILIRRIDLT